MLVAGALAVATPATATAAPRAKEPTNKFCDAFADYYKVGFVVALAGAFAEGLGDEASKKKAEEARNTLLFVFSPKLEQLTAQLGATAPDRQLARAFKRQTRAYAKGVELLKDTGFTDRQIEALANASLDANTDEDQLLGDVKVSKAKINRGAKQFAAKYADDVTIDKPPKGLRNAYVSAGGDCGVFPDQSVDCRSLVDDADVVAIIGPIAKREDKGGSCTFETAENADGDASKVAIDVYASRRAFDSVTENVKNQDVPGVGDQAVALEGINTFTGISTCGRTIVVREGDRTVVGAACVRGGDVDIARLTTLVEHVLAKESSA